MAQYQLNVFRGVRVKRSPHVPQGDFVAVAPSGRHDARAFEAAVLGQRSWMFGGSEAEALRNTLILSLEAICFLTRGNS